MVKFEVRSEEMDKAFKEAIEKVGDLRPALITIAREFYKANKAIFALKSAGKYTDFTGPRIANTWKNPGRPERRTRNGNFTAYQWAKVQAKHPGVSAKGYPLLKATGDLERSITRDGDGNSYKEISPKTIVIGTSVPYAGFHQTGTSRLPMRQFLFIDPSTTAWADSEIFSRRNKAWLQAIDTYVRRVVGESIQS